MGSGYSYGKDYVWVSNGTADTINQECRRRLAMFPPSAARDALDEHFEVFSHMGSGCLGFAVDEEPFDDVEVRTLFARALVMLATDILAAIRGEPHPDELAFLVTLDPFYQASWLANVEMLHDLVRRSLRDPIEPLRLHVDDELRRAIEAHRGTNTWRSRAPYTRADLDERRAHLALVRTAPRYFRQDYVVRLLSSLVDVEDWFGELEAAAATRLRIAELTNDVNLRAFAERARREARFLREVWAAPADDGPREVYADWLLQQHHPRGELIMLQLRGGDAAREAQLLAEHAGAWLGSLAHVILDYRFERGFLAWARVARTQLGDLASHPAWATATIDP